MGDALCPETNTRGILLRTWEKSALFQGRTMIMMVYVLDRTQEDYVSHLVDS